MTGSGLGARPVAAFTTYSATKAAAMTFAEALSYEVGDKVDVMAWVAGEMQTKMLDPKRAKKAMTCEKAVQGMLK